MQSASVLAILGGLNRFDLYFDEHLSDLLDDRGKFPMAKNGGIFV